MTPQETFVTRLRRQRQRHRIALEDLAVDTRIKRELLEALERNDLSEWPRGLYARAWIRAYASAVGLDPVDTVNEFCRLFPTGDRRTGQTIQGIATIVAEPPEYRDEFSHEDRRGASARPRPAPAWRRSLSAVGRTLWLRVTSAKPPALRGTRAKPAHEHAGGDR